MRKDPSNYMVFLLKKEERKKKPRPLDYNRTSANLQFVQMT